MDNVHRLFLVASPNIVLNIFKYVKDTVLHLAKRLHNSQSDDAVSEHKRTFFKEWLMLLIYLGMVIKACKLTRQSIVSYVPSFQTINGLSEFWYNQISVKRISSIYRSISFID